MLFEGKSKKILLFFPFLYSEISFLYSPLQDFLFYTPIVFCCFYPFISSPTISNPFSSLFLQFTSAVPLFPPFLCSFKTFHFNLHFLSLLQLFSFSLPFLEYHVAVTTSFTSFLGFPSDVFPFFPFPTFPFSCTSLTSLSYFPTDITFCQISAVLFTFILLFLQFSLDVLSFYLLS